MGQQLVDLLVFGAYLALIVAFVLALRKGLGVEIRFKEFIQEFKDIAELRWSKRSLNALAMIILFIISSFVFVATFVSGWRGFAYFLLGADPQLVPVIPPLTTFGMVFGFWFVFLVLCFRYTA